MKLAGRQSKNIRTQTPREKTDALLYEKHHRQLFNPEFSGKLTKVSNSMANADRLANKGPGAKAMKAPAGKVTDKFMPFKKSKPKKKS